MTCSRCIHKNVCKIIGRISIIEYDNHNCANFFELVRCKDCKHLVEIDNTSNLYVCGLIDFGMDGEPNFLNPKNDFCSRGERKEIEE